MQVPKACDAATNMSVFGIDGIRRDRGQAQSQSDAGPAAPLQLLLS